MLAHKADSFSLLGRGRRPRALPLGTVTPHPPLRGAFSQWASVRTHLIRGSCQVVGLLQEQRRASACRSDFRLAVGRTKVGGQADALYDRLEPLQPMYDGDRARRSL